MNTSALQVGGCTHHNSIIIEYYNQYYIYGFVFQNDILDWSRDHRVHHKYSETDADPHNAKRGFFFAHVGWLLVKKHPDVTEKGRGLDFSDLYADKIVMFQRRCVFGFFAFRAN